MSRDWRNDRDYDHFDSLDLAGLAWECLRRNDDYRADYGRMHAGGGAPADWGLRFPRRSGHSRACRSRLLAPGIRAGGRHAGRLSAGTRTALRRPYRQHHRPPH